MSILGAKNLILGYIRSDTNSYELHALTLSAPEPLGLHNILISKTAVGYDKDNLMLSLLLF